MRTTDLSHVALASAAWLCFGGCGFSPRGADPDGGEAAVDAPPIDAELDGDGDGVLDGSDNCPRDPNTDQRDHDGDAAGDACDPCPHLPPASTGGDADGDGVGDACDPRPGVGDRIALFEGFYTMPAGWRLTGTWDLLDGHLRHPATDVAASLAVSDRQLDPPYQVEAAVVIDGINGEVSVSGARHAGVVLAINDTADGYYLCSVRDDLNMVSTPARAVIARYQTIDQTAELTNTNLATDLAVGAGFQVRGAVAAGDQSCLGTMAAASGQPTLASAVLPGKGIGLRTFGMAVRYDYLIVYQPAL